MEFYLQGLTIGLAYVAPIGLQNLFVINSALTQKRGPGIFDGADRHVLRCYADARVLLWRGCADGTVPLLQLGVLLMGSLIVCWIGIGLRGARLRLIRAGRT